MSSIAAWRLCCARFLSLPPEKPVIPTVVNPCSLAQATALRMLGLLPEPEMARSRSPGEARVFNCSTKIRSYPSSLAHAMLQAGLSIRLTNCIRRLDSATRNGDLSETSHRCDPLDPDPPGPT